MLDVVTLVYVEAEVLLATDAGYSERRWSGTKVGDVYARVMAG